MDLEAVVEMYTRTIDVCELVLKKFSIIEISSKKTDDLRLL